MSEDFRQGGGWQPPQQPPYEPPPQGGPPYGPPPQSGPQYGPAGGPPYGQPPSGPPQGQPPSGPQYGQPPSGPQYGQPPSGPQYGQQPQYGQPPLGQQPFGQQPQFGQQQFGQPPYGAPQFPPPVDGKRLRPPLWQIAVAWGVAVVFVIAGIALFAGGVTSGVSGAAPGKTFQPGQPATVTIDPADRPALYLSRGTQVSWECQINGNAKLVTTPVNQTVELNGTSWELIALVNAPAAGDYQISCTIEPDAQTRFGVGKDLTAAAGGIMGGVAALFILPAVGVLIAVVWTVVVLVRRSGHRKRLAMGG
ncbi:hypothetical protein ACFWYW_11505 [Nonomuraea sp. NPDC059023]|uniref:hypothetical protein n=1 Tax=unclassified Nonomuraea TaxID=2593643 RepID=UPI003682D185